MGGYLLYTDTARAIFSKFKTDFNRTFGFRLFVFHTVLSMFIHIYYCSKGFSMYYANRLSNLDLDNDLAESRTYHVYDYVILHG